LVFDAIAIVLGLSTAALVTLIAILGYRLRAEELRTLADMGASRLTAGLLVGGELAALVLLGAAIALALAAMAITIVSNASAFV
jgi:hypothetical protein